MASRYVKYGESLEKVKEQARKTLVQLGTETIAKFDENKTKMSLFKNCENTYITMKVIDYFNKEIAGRDNEDIVYDWVYFLTRKSNARKVVAEIVKEVVNIGLFSNNSVGLDALADRLLFKKTVEYFRQNYIAYKIDTTEDGERLWVHSRDKDMTIDEMLKILERDKIDVVLYDEEYCITHSIKDKGAKR